MQRIYDSRTHYVIVMLWGAFEALLGFSLSTEHEIVHYLMSLGIVFPFFAAMTLIGCAVLLAFIFTLTRHQLVFVIFAIVPLLLYALINVILVAKGIVQADRMPLMIGIVSGTMFSWWMANRDEALFRLNSRLTTENAALVSENERLRKLMESHDG